MQKDDNEKLAEVILKIKGMLTTNNSKDITYSQMGEGANFSGINFHKWANQTNTPKSVIATLNLISSLEDHQILAIFHYWREG